jgi:hypothetical protein
LELFNFVEIGRVKGIIGSIAERDEMVDEGEEMGGRRSRGHGASQMVLIP